MTIVEFLEARLADDTQRAECAAVDPQLGDGVIEPDRFLYVDNPDYRAEWAPDQAS